ncbi:MAG TPA: Hpt domain-containing protein [Thermotogota bacterium]|nr:Hpt domain-containing protein [Thermotogota bacterium]HRW34882.1 Hpt domain-containing protein [Thermotogota bacterium]
MIRGLNMTKGLENTGGDLAFYKGLLQDFFDQYSDHAEKILQCVSKGEFSQAELEAHSLKGTSQMLGFEQVYTTALQMELLLKDKDEKNLCRLIAPLKDQLTTLLNDFKRSDLFIQKPEKQLSLKLSEEQKSDLLTRLNALIPVIKTGHYQAEALIVQLIKDYGNFGLKKKLSELKSMIEQLEYENAFDLIKTIQKDV